jgi:hypothetical protein
MDRVKNKDFEFSKRKENLILEKEHSKQAKGPLFCCQVSSFSHFHIHFHTHTHTHTHTAVGIELCHPYFQAKLQIQNHLSPLHFPPKRIKLF